MIKNVGCGKLVIKNLWCGRFPSIFFKSVSQVLIYPSRGLRSIEVALGLWLFCLLGSFPAEARFDPHLIRGVHALFDHHSSHLSPLYGLEWLRSSILQNYRFFGSYGPKKEGLSCFDKTSLGHELREMNDCPQDDFAEFLQRFLASPDFGNIDPNPLMMDGVNRLHPETLGALALEIDQMPSSRVLQKEQEESLTNELAQKLLAIQNPRLKGLEEYQELNTKKRKLGTKLRKLQESGENFSANTEYLVFKQDLDQVSERISQLKKMMDSLPEEATQVRLSDLKPLAHLTVRALRESLIQPEIYSKRMLINTVYAFFFTRYQTKADLLNLLKGLYPDLTPSGKSLISGEASSDLESRDRFLSLQYSREDFTSSASVAEDSEEFRIFLFAVDQFYRLGIPELVTFGSSAHSSLLSGHLYPDCGETAVRNFFNIYLYDSSTHRFDPERLVELEGKLIDGQRVQISKSLLEFYRRHPHPEQAFSQEVRDDWSQNVISGLPGVDYSQPHDSGEKVAEISNGLENLTRVFHQLLFGEPSPSPRGEVTVEKLRDSAKKTWSVLMPRIHSCEFEYDPDQRIRLDVEKNQSPGFNERVQCRLNNGAVFYLHISFDHFFIRIPQLQRALSDSQVSQPSVGQSPMAQSSFLNPFAEDRDLDSHFAQQEFHRLNTEKTFLQARINRSQAKVIALNLPLLTDEGWTLFVDWVLKNQLSELYPQVRAGMSRFPRSFERNLRMKRHLIESLRGTAVPFDQFLSSDDHPMRSESESFFL